MIALNDVQQAVLTAAQAKGRTPALLEQVRFIQGYVAALEDLKHILEDTGVWWQRLVPNQVLCSEVDLRAHFARRLQEVLRP